jgi:two-component system response regulator AtoC
VLLVDDEPLLVDAMGRLLRRAGERVTEAADGVEALQRLREQPVDVILSDVRMPQLDGPGLLRALRDDGDPTPLVFLTGYGDASDGDLVALGASEVLSKPVTLDRLLAALHRAAGE